MTRVSLSDLVPGGFPEPPSRRGSLRAQERRRKRKRRRSLLVLFVAVVVLGGAVGGAYLGVAPVIRQFMEPNDYTGAGQGKVQVTIEPGASGTSIGRTLVEAGVVKTVEAFVEAFKKNPDAAAIQPGIYSLQARIPADDALTALLEPTNRIELRVTIAEGRRAADILQLLADGLDMPLAELQAAAKDVEAIGLPASAKGNLEGYLFPSTYTFRPDVTATQVLAEMIKQTDAELTNAGVAPEQAHEVLTLASLTQAEAGNEADMPKITRVIFNRLKIGRPLQFDSTVNYVLKRSKIKVTQNDLKVRSPYNTYVIKGLPPGPICSPGAAAFKAVLDPAEGTWIYFTTVNPHTGETKFATTAQEKAAMDAELRAWQKAHPNE